MLNLVNQANHIALLKLVLSQFYNVIRTLKLNSCPDIQDSYAIKSQLEFFSRLCDNVCSQRQITMIDEPLAIELRLKKIDVFSVYHQPALRSLVTCRKWCALITIVYLFRYASACFIYISFPPIGGFQTIVIAGFTP